MVTRHWGGLGLALLMQRQGSDVVCATDVGGLTGKELAATELIGDGLVEKMPLAKAMQTLKGPETLWIFDANDLPHEADRLREQGQLVLGTSALSRKLEDDRDYAAQVAEELGFSLPETEEFTNPQAGLQFLQQHADQAFVFKPDKQDPTATYVPLPDAEPEQANDEVQRYLESLDHAPKYILQEQVQGIEVNFELWVHQGKPLAAFCDLEAKRRLVGDLGDLCGCAGDYVFTVPLDHPLLAETVGRYLKWQPLQDYTGSVDANVMLAPEQAYFLENCFRFGYNAYATVFQALATAEAESLFRAWAQGDPQVTSGFSEDVGGSLTLMIDHPQTGFPILIPSPLEAHTYLYRGYHQDSGLAMVDRWSEIACVTALGSTPEEAGSLCLERASQIGFPNKGYRTDLAEAGGAMLPITRYHQLGLR